MPGPTQTLMNEIFNDVWLDNTYYFGLLNAAHTEVAGGSYARQSIPFGAISTNTLPTNNIITITPPATTVYYAGIYDAVSAGNLVHSILLATPRTFNGTTAMQVAVGDLLIVLS